jgi:hypothetical protein
MLVVRRSTVPVKALEEKEGVDPVLRRLPTVDSLD